MFRRSLVAGMLFVMAQAAFAADTKSASGFYVLGSAGGARTAIDKNAIDGALTAVGVTGLSSSVDQSDAGYKLQLGYQFSPNLAVEGGFADLGSFKYSASFTGGVASESIKAKGWNVDLVGFLPINNAVSLLAKVGVIRARVDVSAAATGAGGTARLGVSGNSTSATAGIGITGDLSKNVALRGEVERFAKLGDKNSTGTGSVDLYSVGVVIKF